MDNHGKYPPLERPRLMEGGGGSSGGGGSNGAGGSHPPSASEYSARVSTPTTMTTLAQYHSRYGLPPALPGSNLALMSSFINGTHSLKPRGSLLPDIQHYWNAPPETFPRYLMTGSLYPTYQPLLPGSESLSLLGAGVACVASAVTTGMGPSQPHQVAHYQQLLEIQKEAYLASMSAAASHHTAIYGISGTPLSPFLDQASASSHSPSPLSLVKQEPKDQSCSDKSTKQSERRSAAFKVDVDLNRSTRETVSISLPTSNSLNTQLKEPKLSPTSMEMTGKLDKKASNSRASSSSANNGKMPTTPVCDSSSMPKFVSGSRHNRPTQSASSSPSPKAARTPHQAHTTSNARRSAPQSSDCASSNQWQLSASTGHSSSMSSSPASMLEPSIISVPTKTPSPIALATVQHDGVVLSALASHSSAAASSVSTKTVFLKQQMDKVVYRAFSDADRPTTVATTVSGLADRLSGTTQSCDRRPLASHSNGYSDRDINSTVNGHRMDVRDQTDDSKLLSDDNSDIVVDSTESDDNPPANEPAVITKSDHERLVEETIERVASAADSDLGSDQDEATFHNCTPSRHSSSGTSMICVTRVNTTNTVTLSGSSTATRTVYAKTQPVLSVAVSGCLATSNIITSASSSALPYYHRTCGHSQAAKRIHATTFVPEVGVLKKYFAKAVTAKSAVVSPTSKLPSPSHFNQRRQDSNYSSPNEQRLRSKTTISRSSTTKNVTVFSDRPETSDGTASEIFPNSTSLCFSRPQSVVTLSSDEGASDSDEEPQRENEQALLKYSDHIKSLTFHSPRSDSKLHNHHLARKCRDNDNVGGAVVVNKPVLASSSTQTMFPRKFDTTRGSQISNRLGDNDSLASQGGSVGLVAAVVDDLPGRHEVAARKLHPMPFTGELLPSPTSSVTKALTDSSPHVEVNTTNRQDMVHLLNHSLKSIITDVGELKTNSRRTNKRVSEPILWVKGGNTSAIVTRLSTPSTKTAARLELPKSPAESSVVTPTFPSKLTSPKSDSPKLELLTSTNPDFGSNEVSMRPELHIDNSLARCETASPAASTSVTKHSSSHFPPDSCSISQREVKWPDKLDTGCDHYLGNIPVGIAVAQIRPHHAQQSKEYQVSESVTGETRHVHASVSTKTISTPAASLAAPASSLVVTGPAVNQSPWIQQMPFPLHQTMSSSGTTFDPSFPITAPSGFKFAQDSMTGQFFLIPSGEFVKPGGVWSSQNCAPPTETGSSHYQPTLNPTTVTIKETEKREGKHTRVNNTGTSSSTASTSEKIIPAQETASKEKPGMAGDDGKHHVKSQPSIGGSRGASSQALASSSSTTAATVLVNPVTHVSSISPAVLVKLERPTVESRGCSPIHFEDISSPLSLLSTLSCLSSVKKPATSTVGVQTCDNLMRSGCKRKRLLHNQAVQTSSHDFSTYNPLSVQCPDMDSVDPLTHSVEDKTHSDRVSYNPFTDPQILQAADGLELLSTLAEKRPKCTSLDDPKRIFPSPSDSFKSDSTSIVAFDDTLSPADAEMKSGQCTPRREILRDLSPKWSIPKKEPHTASAFADFKTPSEIDNQEDSEVRVKLAEVQRQYKEKQKELAKLQSKKTEESKMSKRGPGRPPKKKTPSKKSDDESSSSSSKTKEHQLPKKKKRPAEELVDRVFRKLPPVIKPSKVSRSIHYVKSKTGPFFRRKSASSSVKRNKDLFGYDESTWPSFSERKHQEKVKRCESTNGQTQSRHRSSSSHSEDSKHSQDAGNIFSNLESFGADYVEKLCKPQDYAEKICKPQDYVEKICKPQDYVEKICKPQDYVEKRGRPSKLNLHKLEKMPTSAPGTPVIKTEFCSSISHQESGLGLLAKFAVSEPASSVSPLATLASSSTSSSNVNYNTTSAVSSFSSNVFSNNTSTIYAGGVHNSSHTSLSGQAPNITFGSICSFVSSATSSMVSFSNHNLAAPNLNSTTSTAMMSSSFAPLAISTTSSSVTVSPTSSEPPTAAVTPAQLFPSIQIHEAVTEDSSSTFSSAAASCCLTTNNSTINIIINSPRNCCSRNSSPVSSSVTDPRDISPAKRKFEEDSDTDASDTSLNRKRKPGRPRKMNPEKSLCATETIWAKKSPNITQIQAPEPIPSQPKDDDAKKIDASSMKPLFLDEEWTRRRSERIFLSESSPQPSPALSPAPRGEIVWKLSHFMPKSRKMLDVNKSIRDGEDDKDNQNPSEDQPPSLHLDPPKSSQIPAVPSSTGMTAVKTEGKESLSWTATKTVEISTFKLEDSKKILKLEDSTQSMPLQEITKVSKSDDSEKKKMAGKKKVKKAEVPQTVTTLPTLEMKEKRAEENSKMKLQKAKSLHDLTQRVKKKFSKAGMKKQDDYQLKNSKEGKKKRKISTDSSDADNIPLVSYKVNPPTPESRSCKLQQSDLREGLKVLYLVDGLFHEGTVKALQPPDVYGVLTAGQRGNRPHILCLEEILKWAVLDVKPDSLRYLPEGTRVCAFWSQQFSCLYPGTVAKSSPISNGKKVGISVEFDDGDNGRIELDHIRLLPSDFPIVEYEPDPLETLPKRKQRTTSDASDRRKSAETETKPSKHSKEIEEDVDNDNNSKDDTESDNTGPVAKQKLWRWEGKSTKRPGLKGKAKKVFYKAITRRKETIRVGDSAIFVSKERVNCPYIGRIESLWQGWNGQKMVRVQWYYHPEETECAKKLADPRNALFESQHEDENDVQTIAHKCEVLTFAQYKKRLSKVSKKGRSLRSNVFFVAGFYDPAAKDITFHPGVS